MNIANILSKIPTGIDQSTLLPIGVVIILILIFIYLRGNLASNIVSNDTMEIMSQRLGLVGRPDRIVKLKDGTWIPMEKKSGGKAQESHRIQIGVYFILLEEHTGRKPPYGFIVLGNNDKVKVINTDKLRERTMRHIEAARAQKLEPKNPVKATPFPAKCQNCGYRNTCKFAKL